jgi:hypothetical protein
MVADLEARDVTALSDRGRRGHMPVISDRVPSRAEPPDGLTLELDIDDKPLKEIIGSLCYPDCPYEFSLHAA